MSLVWTEKTLTETQAIQITSVPGLLAALSDIGCTIQTQVVEIENLKKAMKANEKALALIDTVSPMTSTGAQELENAVEKAIQTGQDLLDAMKAAESTKPSSLVVKDRNGKQRTLNWKHGAYIVEWTEKLRTSNRGHREAVELDNSRNFASELLDANMAAQQRLNSEHKARMAKIRARDANLNEKLEKASSIRQKWEAIEANRQLQNLREERASAVESRGKKMGYRTKRVVDNKKEIVISLRRTS